MSSLHKLADDKKIATLIQTSGSEDLWVAEVVAWPAVDVVAAAVGWAVECKALAIS